jgi:hypothetical protein
VSRLAALKTYGNVVVTENNETVVREADGEINEQVNDPTLANYFDMVRRSNKQFFVPGGLLYRRGMINGNQVEQLCLPQKRVETVFKWTHNMPASGHQVIRSSSCAPNERSQSYCDSCQVHQMRALERRTDLVPIRPTE